MTSPNDTIVVGGWKSAVASPSKDHPLDEVLLGTAPQLEEESQERMLVGQEEQLTSLSQTQTSSKPSPVRERIERLNRRLSERSSPMTSQQQKLSPLATATAAAASEGEETGSLDLDVESGCSGREKPAEDKSTDSKFSGRDAITAAADQILKSRRSTVTTNASDRGVTEQETKEESSSLGNGFVPYPGNLKVRTIKKKPSTRTKASLQP